MGNKGYILNLCSFKVEVSYYTYSRGFKIRLPSQLYLNKTEGLCGNCNNEETDDAFSNEVSLNWLVSKLLKEPSLSLPLGEELCQVLPQPECKPLHPDRDPCLKLLDSDLFKVELNLLQLISAFKMIFIHSILRCAMLW